MKRISVIMALGLVLALLAGCITIEIGPGETTTAPEVTEEADKTDAPSEDPTEPRPEETTAEGSWLELEDGDYFTNHIPDKTRLEAEYADQTEEYDSVWFYCAMIENGVLTVDGQIGGGSTDWSTGKGIFEIRHPSDVYKFTLSESVTIYGGNRDNIMDEEYFNECFAPDQEMEGDFFLGLTITIKDGEVTELWILS